jgi:hypothetical protein
MESRTGGAPDGRDEQPNRAVWVQSKAGRRLWLVRDEFRDGERLPTFVGVVPDARVSAEVARDIQRRGEAPETVDESLLRTLQQTGQAPAGDPPVAPTRSGSHLPPDPRPAIKDVRVVWVQSKVGRRLWQVKDEIHDGVRYPTFVQPVPEALVAAAVATHEDRLHEAPETVDESLLRTLQKSGQALNTP